MLGPNLFSMHKFLSKSALHTHAWLGLEIRTGMLDQRNKGTELGSNRASRTKGVPLQKYSAAVTARALLYGGVE